MRAAISLCVVFVTTENHVSRFLSELDIICGLDLHTCAIFTQKISTGADIICQTMAFLKLCMSRFTFFAYATIIDHYTLLDQASSGR